jgi:hypothetical protein
MKVIVELEEVLRKEIEVDVDSETEEEAKRIAEEQVLNDYIEGDIVLTADDFYEFNGAYSRVVQKPLRPALYIIGEDGEKTYI